MQNQTDPKDPKKKEGYADGESRKIINEQDQQSISNMDDAGSEKISEAPAVKPLLNEDTSEQKDTGTPESIEADRKKDAGINP